MNTQLIPVFAGELSGAPAQLVDARLLHDFLEVTTKFADWITRRIEEYSFIENQDFLVSQIWETKTGRGGNRKAVIDYHLTIDMAKELGMIERSEKGRQIRRYFLEMERIAQRLHTLQQLPEPKTKKALPGGLTLEQQDTIKALVKQRAEELPKDKQAGAVIKQWAAIKQKFGCTYKEVSPDNFVNILSLLSRLPLEGELLDKQQKIYAYYYAVKIMIDRQEITQYGVYSSPKPITDQYGLADVKNEAVKRAGDDKESSISFRIEFIFVTTQPTLKKHKNSSTV